jgi:hypothetical protein
MWLLGWLLLWWVCGAASIPENQGWTVSLVILIVLEALEDR